MVTDPFPLTQFKLFPQKADIVDDHVMRKRDEAREAGGPER